MDARVTPHDPSATAETVLRLAVLLQAGLSPVRAWTHLADAGDASAARVVAAVGEHTPLVDAIGEAAGAAHRSRRARRGGDSSTTPSDAWADVAAAWRVAAAVGAPLAESLRSLAATLRDMQEASDDVRVALAEPAATARLMGWLPLVAVALGLALGFDTIGVLLRQPLGWIALAAGLALIVTAQRWSSALVRRARAESGFPGLGPELLAIALSGGVSIDRAVALVDATGVTMDASTRGLLSLSRSAGVPAVELLRASASLARHRARVEGRLRAARLSSRLLLPLGVCTLPAFLLLGVAPMLLSVMTAAPLTL